ISTVNWYANCLMYRSNSMHLLHRFGHLFQQYIVDMYAKIEHSRLGYYVLNQKKMRAELYSGIQDAVYLNDNDMTNLGWQVIIPSSFLGSPRCMRELYQDAMGIVHYFGKPDLFVTFTCNPTWPEITNSLLGGQSASNRPDLCFHVFHMKLEQLMHDLTKKHILAKVVAHVHVIEFQKRGHPHAHILLILAMADKPPEAFAIISRHMVHELCGEKVCLANVPLACYMKNGRCQKHYPKNA
ncbi:hypothetical protein PHYBLDRAFT_18833, partial [Phycomyces blakesleeanus NRRL 1555(-)]